MAATARKIKQPAATVNQTASSAAAPAAKPNLMALSAAVWETVGYVTKKEARRDDVPDGASYPGIELAITAKIAGQIYRQYFTADLTVGHGQDVAQSNLPNTGAIVGHILAQLNEKTREAVLKQLPAIYASNGGELPDVPAGIAEAADGLLSKLRATKSVHRRGAVSAKYSPAQPSLQLVG